MLLFTVFIAATFDAHAQQPLFGQAGRQVFFIVDQRLRLVALAAGPPRRRDKDAPRDHAALGDAQRAAAYLVVAAGAVVLCQWVFSVIGAGWPAPRWYYWCDAWIFVGSMVATYAMARGWTDFWLVVDRRRPRRRTPARGTRATTRRPILFVVYGALRRVGLPGLAREPPVTSRPPTATDEEVPA